MPRWLRLLLTGLAFAIGFVGGGLAGTATSAGFAWIFVFGDDPWPAWSDYLIGGMALICALVIGTGFARSAWRACARTPD